MSNTTPDLESRTDNPEIVAILVHGTFARNTDWTKHGSKLQQCLLSDNASIKFIRFKWSGNNNFRHREKAIESLSILLKQLESSYPHSKLILIGHSHGGNVITATLARFKPNSVVGVAYLSVPFVHVAAQPQFSILHLISPLFSFISGIIIGIASYLLVILSQYLFTLRLQYLSYILYVNPFYHVIYFLFGIDLIDYYFLPQDWGYFLFPVILIVFYYASTSLSSKPSTEQQQESFSINPIYALLLPLHYFIFTLVAAVYALFILSSSLSTLTNNLSEKTERRLALYQRFSNFPQNVSYFSTYFPMDEAAFAINTAGRLNSFAFSFTSLFTRISTELFFTIFFFSYTYFYWHHFTDHSLEWRLPLSFLYALSISSVVPISSVLFMLISMLLAFATHLISVKAIGPNLYSSFDNFFVHLSVSTTPAISAENIRLVRYPDPTAGFKLPMVWQFLKGISTGNFVHNMSYTDDGVLRELKEWMLSVTSNQACIGR